MVWCQVNYLLAYGEGCETLYMARYMNEPFSFENRE